MRTDDPQHEHEAPATGAAIRRLNLLALAFLFFSVAPMSAAENRSDFDWSIGCDLPVQQGGRHKPLDTMAREMLRLLCNRATISDPDTRDLLDPTGWYLTMLFDWQGWEHEDRDRLLSLPDYRPFYFHFHKPDKWDRAPLLRIDHLELRALLGVNRDQTFLSPLEVSEARIEEPTSGKLIRFTTWADRLGRQEAKGGELETLEKKALDLAQRFWSYQHLRMGRSLELVPIRRSVSGEWMSFAQLFLTSFNDGNDPAGELRQAQGLLQRLVAAHGDSDAAAFNRSLGELKGVLRAVGSARGDYPSTTRMDIEVAFNRWAPFRFAWIFVLLSALAMLLHLGSRWQLFHAGALVFYILGLAALVTGFAGRISIAGRPPVTNMYESVVYVGFGVALFGLVFEIIFRAKYILMAAAAVSTIALILADNSPNILDPSLRPLEPVLRSNFWLVTHVMTITLAYAAFALALGIANITLGYFLAGAGDRPAVAALSHFTYKAIQVGVLLLAAGVILGGVWADYSWGRFWGWDPKEVWALVALLSYLCVLHARFIGWVGQRGLAALATVCFSVVIMAWYGVNFVLGAGLHSYGFGGGGKGWILAAILVQLLYAGLALLRSQAASADDPTSGSRGEVQVSASQPLSNRTNSTNASI